MCWIHESPQQPTRLCGLSKCFAALWTVPSWWQCGLLPRQLVYQQCSRDSNCKWWSSRCHRKILHPEEKSHFSGLWQYTSDTKIVMVLPAAGLFHPPEEAVLSQRPKKKVSSGRLHNLLSFSFFHLIMHMNPTLLHTSAILDWAMSVFLVLY